MPKSWYDLYSIKIDYDNDSEEEIKRKKLYKKICAHKKPYFFMHNYLGIKAEYDKYMANVDLKSYSIFKMSYKDLVRKEPKTEKEAQFVQWAQHQVPVDMSPSLMNRVCWAIEKELGEFKDAARDNFNCSMIKSGYKYSKSMFKNIESLYKQYKTQISNFEKMKKSEYYLESDTSDDEGYGDVQQLRDQFAEKCAELCPNQYELCDILIDLCYKGRSSKEIVWHVCGETIIDNLLKNNNKNMYYPEKVDDNEEFWCCGQRFVMKKLKIGGDDE